MPMTRAPASRSARACPPWTRALALAPPRTRALALALPADMRPHACAPRGHAPSCLRSPQTRALALALPADTRPHACAPPRTCALALAPPRTCALTPCTVRRADTLYRRFVRRERFPTENPTFPQPVEKYGRRHPKIDGSRSPNRSPRPIAALRRPIAALRRPIAALRRASDALRPPLRCANSDAVLLV